MLKKLEGVNEDFISLKTILNKIKLKYTQL